MGWEKISSVGLYFFPPLYFSHPTSPHYKYNTYKSPSLVDRSSPLLTTLGLKSKHLIKTNFNNPFLAWLALYKSLHQTVMMSALLYICSYYICTHRAQENTHTHIYNICMYAGPYTQHTHGIMHHHADCSHGVVQSKLQYVHRCPLHEWGRYVRLIL